MPDAGPQGTLVGMTSGTTAVPGSGSTEPTRTSQTHLGGELTANRSDDPARNRPTNDATNGSADHATDRLGTQGVNHAADDATDHATDRVANRVTGRTANNVTGRVTRSTARRRSKNHSAGRTASPGHPAGRGWLAGSGWQAGHGSMRWAAALTLGPYLLGLLGMVLSPETRDQLLFIAAATAPFAAIGTGASWLLVLALQRGPAARWSGLAQGSAAAATMYATAGAVLLLNRIS